MAIECSNSQINRSKVAWAIRLLLEGLGENPDREGLKETPRRVARMYEELLVGKHTQVKITTFQTEDYDELIIVKDIPMYSLCEHHLLPFVGKAHVAYLPDGALVGISKLARLVEALARRLQIQERLTRQIVVELCCLLNPQWVMVVIEAEHLCMTMRGVKKPGAKTVTSYMAGSIEKNSIKAQNLKLEMLNLIES